MARAKELLLLGRPITGVDAAAWGMIHRAVPVDEVGAAAEVLVAELASAATVAVGLAKHCIHRSLALGLDEAMDLEAHALEPRPGRPTSRRVCRRSPSAATPTFEGR